MSTLSSELKKMLAGELYLASDPELVSMRKRARRLTRNFNQTTEEDRSLRTEILKELFGSVEGKIEIEPPFQCDYGVHIYAGQDLFMNFGCVVLDCAEVHIGKQVAIGPHVQIYTATHPLDAELRCSGPELAKEIRIDDCVWIGGGSILCPGVTIGKGSTIGAGSVVVKDIPPHVLAAGNPCRVIRKLK
jgi:maltose O-acetyltransferase